MEYTFLAIPKFALKRDDLSCTDKIIYGLLLGFQSNGDSWASNEYISRECCIPIRTVARSLNTLEEAGLIQRSTQTVGVSTRRRMIRAISNVTECQNGTEECQNGTGVVPKWHRVSAKMAQGECQNGTILNNIYNIKDKTNECVGKNHTLTPDMFSLFELESGSGRRKIKAFPLLSLTQAELDKSIEMLNNLGFNTTKKIELILITASAMSESSKSAKPECRSFAYIVHAINDLMGVKKKKKEYQSAMGSTALRPERKIVTASR